MLKRKEKGKQEVLQVRKVTDIDMFVHCFISYLVLIYVYEIKVLSACMDPPVNT